MKDTIKGILIMASVHSLYQDIRFGSAEKYAEYLLDGHWVDKSITIPIAIIALLLVIFWKKE